MTVINALNGLATYASSLSAPETSSLSLEERVVQAYANKAVAAEAEQTDIINSLQISKTTSDPAELARLQQRTSDYALEVAFLGALTKKVVATAETLLRS